jgi:hypothetical protein
MRESTWSGKGSAVRTYLSYLTVSLSLNTAWIPSRWWVCRWWLHICMYVTVRIEVNNPISRLMFNDSVFQLGTVKLKHTVVDDYRIEVNNPVSWLMFNDSVFQFYSPQLVGLCLGNWFLQTVELQWASRIHSHQLDQVQLLFRLRHHISIACLQGTCRVS